MDKKSKVLMFVLLIIILASAGYTYYKIMILRDFEVVNSAEEVSETINSVQN